MKIVDKKILVVIAFAIVATVVVYLGLEVFAIPSYILFCTNIK